MYTLTQEVGFREGDKKQWVIREDGELIITYYRESDALRMVMKLNKTEYNREMQQAKKREYELAEALTKLLHVAEKQLDQSATHEGLNNCNLLVETRKAMRND